MQGLCRVARDQDNPFTDDLFEPFELDDYPAEGDVQLDVPPRPAPAPPPVQESAPMVRCPSCGAENPAHNRHCEECGARLSQGPLPVAPAPMIRSTPGVRALGVLGGVVLIVALIALFLNLFGGEDPTALPEGDGVATTTSPTEPTEAQTELQAASVEASSELPNGFEATNLIDGNTNTYWNDSSQRGVGATLTFTFAQPVSIGEMELVNIQDEASFRRNYRIKDLQVTVDDLAIELPWQLSDSPEPQRMPLNTLETRRLTITVLGTYPGEPVGGDPSFTELALAEVRFFGSVNQ